LRFPKGDYQHQNAERKRQIEINEHIKTPGKCATLPISLIGKFNVHRAFITSGNMDG
jgi:hypothetical protein